MPPSALCRSGGCSGVPGQGLSAGLDISITMGSCPWPEETRWETALRLAGCFW